MNTNIPQAYYACYVILGLYKTAMKTGQEVNRNAVIVIHCTPTNVLYFFTNKKKTIAITNQFKNNVMSIYLMWNSFTTFMMTKGLQK